MSKLVHTESIYSYIVVYPEMTRMKTGTYFSSKVGVALLLIVINITMQVSLTFITGESILASTIDYKKSLLGRADDPLNVVVSNVGDGGEDVADVAKDVKVEKKLKDIEDKQKSLDLDLDPDLANKVRSSIGRGERGQSCCTGVVCSGGQMLCCRGAGRSAAPAASSFLNHTGFLKLGKPSGGKKGEGEEGGVTGGARKSLCLASGDLKGSVLDCSPPAAAFLDSWPDLDSNQDGVWTKDEAAADAANLGCKLGTDLPLIFNAVVSGSIRYAQQFRGGSTAPSIRSRQGVPHRYFVDWLGIVALCGAVDPDRCPSLIESGVYNGALKAQAKGAPIDGITSLDEALDHCQNMLQAGGICQKALPVTHMIYRQQVASKCGSPTFITGNMYVNPYDPTDVMRTVTLAYPNLDTYEMAASYVFQFFMSIIVFVWYLALLGEAISLCNLADFTWNFPAAKHADPLSIRRWKRRLTRRARDAAHFLSISVGASVEQEANIQEASPFSRRPSSTVTPRGDEEAVTISDICTEHRMLCAFILFVRGWLMIYMAIIGTIFLQNTYSYPDLLMNAVALAFVFELPEFLYGLLVSGEDHELLETVGELPFETGVPKAKGIWTCLVEINFWGLAVFPCVVLLMCAFHYYYTIDPVNEALGCACLQAGERCAAARTLSRSWWDAQWALPMS